MPDVKLKLNILSFNVKQGPVSLHFSFVFNTVSKTHGRTSCFLECNLMNRSSGLTL